MTQLHNSTITSGPLAGRTLIRMRRPAEWDYYCTIETCPNLAPQGYRRMVPSVWSVETPDGRFIGWRAACGRKHAIEIWERELAGETPAD